nr:unnamed protein product [Chocolate lily virus A]
GPSDDAEFIYFDAEEEITPMVSKIGYVSTAVPQLSKSQIEESPIFDSLCQKLGDPKVAPTILSKHDPRPPTPYDPYSAGIRKFDKEVGPFDWSEESDLQFACAEILDTWQTKKPEKFAIETVCSLDVAINGVHGLPFAENFPIGTSEGFPWVLDRARNESGKERFFEEVAPGHRVPRGSWVEDIAEIEEAAYRGDYLTTTITCAKDEKTKLDKVFVNPKTRIFEMLNFCLNLVIRKYFFFWMQWMMSLHSDLPCKVGINPFSYDWDIMAMKHSAYANHFCGDYSGFDTNTNVELVVRIGDMISDMADDGPRNRVIRRNLLRCVLNRQVIVGRDLYKVKGGTPSGFALTVMINSVVNEIYLKMAWFGLSRKYDPLLARDADLRHHVCMSVYGDDNVVSFSHNVANWYNLVTISSYLRPFGIKLTDGQKTGVMVPFTSFDKIDFLKRKWVQGDKGWFRCPLDPVSIESQLYYLKRSDDPIDALRVNVDNALREAFQHGTDYFVRIKCAIVSSLQEAQIDYLPPSELDCARFWAEQRSCDHLPIHFADPRYRAINILDTKVVQTDVGFSMSVHEYRNRREEMEKLNRLCIIGGDSKLETGLTVNGAKFAVVGAKNSELVDSLARLFKIGFFTGKKWVFSALNPSLAHVVHICLLNVTKEHRLETVQYVSQLDDKSYKFMIELNAKIGLVPKPLLEE